MQTRITCGIVEYSSKIELFKFNIVCDLENQAGLPDVGVHSVYVNNRWIYFVCSSPGYPAWMINSALDKGANLGEVYLFL